MEENEIIEDVIYVPEDEDSDDSCTGEIVADCDSDDSDDSGSNVALVIGAAAAGAGLYALGTKVVVPFAKKAFAKGKQKIDEVRINHELRKEKKRIEIKTKELEDENEEIVQDMETK
jgi:hypothetical protein